MLLARSFGGAFAMYEGKTNFRASNAPKKTRKEVNQRFRTNHQLIQISFKKEAKRGLSEYEILIKNAKSYSNSLGRYIKNCALEPRIKVIEKEPLINQKMFMEIHKIGVNINQIAYKVNAKVDQKEFPDFENTLAELDQKLNEVLNFMRSKY